MRPPLLRRLSGGPAGLAVLLAALLAACRTTIAPRPEREVTVIADSPPVDPAGGLRVEGPADLGREIALPGGRVSKMYFFKPQKGKALEPLLKDHLKITEIHFIENYETSSGAVSGYKPAATSDLMIVSGTDEEIALVDEFLDVVEGQMPQIEIKARIVEITRTNDREIGVTTDIREDPAHRGTVFRDLTGRFNTESFLRSLLPGTLGGFQGTVLRVGSLQNKIDLNLVVELLEQETQAEILSAPTVRVLNGYQALIKTGDQIPIQKVTTVGSNFTVGVDYRDTGVSLSVIPWIVSRDTVRLEIKPEVSTVTGFTAPQPGVGFSNPLISTRNAITTVNVRDGEIFSLGGLLINNQVDAESKIPLLGDIPLLGFLFRTTRKTKLVSELIFLIQPRILSDLPAGGDKTILPPAERRP